MPKGKPGKVLTFNVGLNLTESEGRELCALALARNVRPATLAASILRAELQRLKTTATAKPSNTYIPLTLNVPRC